MGMTWLTERDQVQWIVSYHRWWSRNCITTELTLDFDGHDSAFRRLLTTVITDECQELPVRVDWSFILRRHRFSFSPLPVIVAIVVDLLDCDRGLRRDVVWKVVGTLVDLVLL